MVLNGMGQHFSRNLDQYTIMCVFGSVFGCVFLPLVAQSIESLIITALLLGVTMKTWKKNPLGIGGGGGGGGVSGGRETLEDRRKEKKGKKSTPKRHGAPQTIMDGETMRKQRKYDMEKQEEIKLIDKERRLEEKRERKARKREVTLQKREEQKVEKEREAAAQQDRMKDREQRKKKTIQKMEKFIPSVETVVAMTANLKPLRRERKYSTSSSISSISSSSSISGISTHSAPSPTLSSKKACPSPHPPVRASSAPLILATPPMSLYQHAINREVPPVYHVLGSHTPPPKYHVPMLPHAQIPLVTDMTTPHPHYFYNSLPQLNTPSPVQPRPCYTPPNSATMETSWIGDTATCTGHVPLKSAWPDLTPHHMTTMNRQLAQLIRAPLHNDVIRYDVVPRIGGCGPAQDFYSFLHEQACNTGNTMSSTPSSPSNIWSPPSDDQLQGEGLEVWPNV